MSISRRVAKNTAYIFLANAAGHLVVFLAGVVIARRLTVGEFGVLAFARSFPQLFIVVADLGIEYLVVREVAVRRETASEYVGRLIPFKLVLTATALAASIGALFLSGRDPHTVAVTVLFSCYAIGRTMITFLLSPLKGFEKMGGVSLVLILENGLAAALIFAFLNHGDSAVRLGIWYNITAAAALVLTVILLIRTMGLPRLGVDAALWKATVAASWPFALNAVSVLLNNNVDIVILTFFKGKEQVGLYTACVYILSVVGYSQSALVSSAYPVVSRLFAMDPGALKKSYEKLFKLVSVTGLPLCVGGAMVAGPLLSTLFKKSYGAGAGAFVILSAGVVFTNYASLFGMFTAGIHKQKEFGVIYIGSTVMNVILNLALVPRFGIIGSSVATLISNASVIIVGYMIILKPYQQFPALDFGARLGGALCAMAAALYLLRGMHVYALIPAGAAVYAAALFVFRPFSKDDAALVRKALSGGGSE